ncbi:MAG: xanthine dehydrogenase family protein molybdopterin-binding subunit [Proteobacteria bacterium]|nr:xanthine dehydrogenase family protein molybdopterin-binding subunit [Pseudomonadota bacterium]
MTRPDFEEVLSVLYPDPDGGDRGVASTTEAMDRRTFLRISSVAGGGLLIAVSLPGCKSGQGDDKTAGNKDKNDKNTPTPVESEPLPTEPFEANAFVEIKPDNSATITVAKSEMGQGVRTTLAMIIAEELDLDWSKVVPQTAPTNPKKYGRQTTGGSASVRTGWKPLREAGARARAMLVAAAAQKLQVDAKSLKTDNGHVIHADSGRKLTYGSLTEIAAEQSVPETVVLKDAKEFKLLGKEHIGIDAADIVQGKATYGIDIRMPNMLFASIERTPVFGGKVKSFKADAAFTVAGVKKVVEVPATGPMANVHSGVAVIAETTWAAMQGRAKLDIQWDQGPHAKESSAGYRTAMERFVGGKGKELVNRLGNPDKVLAKAKGVVRARYDVPFIAHSTMEPMNCTAEVKGDRCLIRGPIQTPDLAPGPVGKALGIPPENVEVQISLLGGGFGRRLNLDYVVEAALVAKHVDVPVQVVWTREDDMTHDFYRPMAMHAIEASLDKDGYPEAWRHRMTTPAIRATIDPNAKDHGVSESNGASDMLYRVPNRSCEYTYLPSGVTRGWWRAVHTTHTTFAVESFIDELAEKAGKDPYEYRMHLIDELTVDRPKPNKEFPWDPARLKGVLKLAAEKAGWGKTMPKGRAMGIACGIDHLSYAAVVIELSTASGKPLIHRVVCAADCGPVLNPNGGRAQLEGGLVQGLSAALKEKITIVGGRVQQNNFDSYSILRINEAPTVIETHFANTDAHPTGLGEPSVPPTAPALANAIYRATGKRPRSLPIDLAIL